MDVFSDESLKDLLKCQKKCGRQSALAMIESLTEQELNDLEAHVGDHVQSLALRPSFEGIAALTSAAVSAMAVSASIMSGSLLASSQLLQNIRGWSGEEHISNSEAIENALGIISGNSELSRTTLATCAVLLLIVVAACAFMWIRSARLAEGYSQLNSIVREARSKRIR